MDEWTPTFVGEGKKNKRVSVYNPPMNGDPAEAHLLVVDDDQRLRDLLRRYLVESGFRITTAGDAAEARLKLQSMAFDLLIVDVMMPGESGLALTESLRQTSAVPILLLTAMAEPGDRITGLERGADDYLAKPFEPRELQARLRAILRRKGAPAKSETLRFGRLEIGRASCRERVFITV